MASTVLLRAQAASLRRDFPQWRVIISTAGRFWAQKHVLVKIDGRVIFDYNEDAEGDTARDLREMIAAKELTWPCRAARG